jgi:hypothetical protein
MTNCSHQPEGIVLVTCTDCGDMEMPAAECKIVTALGYNKVLEWRCRGCGVWMTRPLGFLEEGLLEAIGVRYVKWRVPEGKPFTDDDVENLMAFCDQDYERLCLSSKKDS